MNLRTFSSVKDRRVALEQERGVKLPHIGSFSLDESRASSRNCENMIGVAQIPLGIAGPLDVRRQTSDVKRYYLPLATTEGALIASINRGCKAIREAGGATVVVERVGTTRGPVFKTESLANSYQLKQWITDHQELLNQTAKQTSTHIRLLSAMVHIQGPLVFVRFAFDTQDAMGMNMVTIATEAIGQVIQQENKVRFLSVSGNFCVDKKPSWQNALLGRGFRAWSEVVLPTTLLAEVLKTTPESLLETWQAKCLIGSALSGSLGFNGQAANVIAALYLACGQDVAHVVEGSSAITTMENTSDGIRVSVSLPSVLVGTVGGGTMLATQQEALTILGIKHPEELAEVVVASVLAGEISELAALASHTLVCAHQTLGRGGK